MALCLANSLIGRKGFCCYDQLVRYRWWQIHGYMSSTGKCFDIGAATRKSLEEFSRRQRIFAEEYQIPLQDLDYLYDENLLQKFDVFCSEDGVAGNGALMRLTPVPLFFYRNPKEAVQFAGISAKITHGDQKAVDACRYYSALIVASLQGETKEQLLHQDFYLNHSQWFNGEDLHEEIFRISQGSFKRDGGYDDGIRGKGYIVNALEAALWAFWSDENSFEKGALAAVNLGDDTDTTAAIYGQLAGAFYGFNQLPSHWIEQIYAKKFIEILSKWILYQGQFSLSNTSDPPQKRISNIEEYPKPSINSQQSEEDSIIEQTWNDLHQINHTSNFPNGEIIHSKTLHQNQTQRSSPFESPRLYSRDYSTPTNTQSSTHTNVLSWKTNDVIQWIQSLGEYYSSYEDSFRNDVVDGFRLISFINEQRLIYYGITNQNHRQTILNAIQLIRNDLFNQPRSYRYYYSK